MNRIRPYLRLIRLPAVFTAPADVLAGYAVMRHGWGPWEPLAALVAAGVCLYAGGMALNDWFDRAVDAEERKERPIPAGEVSPRAAALLGFGLLTVGVGFGFLGGWLAGNLLRSGLVALCVAVLVVLYDGPLKKTLLACPAMGACRAANLLLGASAADFLRHGGVWTVALAMGCYIGGVTMYARREARPAESNLLTTGFVAVNLGFATLLYAYLTQDWVVAPELLPAVVLASIALSVDRRLVAGIREPTPENVGPAIRVAVLSVITLGTVTVMAATADAVLTLAVACLLIPAALLKRVAAVT